MATLHEAKEETVMEYWDWFCKLNKRDNPALNNDGDLDEKHNTNKDYFFLSPCIGGASNRICNVPSGKRILIPSLSCLASTGEGEGLNIDDLNRFADVDHENIVYRRIEIDGKPLVGDLEKRYRIRTEKPFKVNYPAHAIFNAKPGESDAVADGVYIICEFPPGEHIVHFEGRINVPEDQDSLEPREYLEDVTYTLRIK
jgi:hypothetical protein